MIKLFGYFINKDDLSDYVSLVRQALQECGTPGKSSGKSFCPVISTFVIGADSKIKDVNHFLRLLGDSVSGDTASKVYKHLSDFLLFVGLLSDIDISMLPTGVCGTNFNQNNNFHTTIEVWQNVLSTLVSLEERYPGHHLSIMQTLGGIDGYHHSTATIEICQVILWDLVLVAHSKYKVMKPGELLRSSPFCCACMKQMWKTIISHFDSSETHPFWFCLQQIWRISKQDVNSDIDIDSNMFLFPPSVEWKNEIKAEFWWWLTMNITDLYENDHQHQNAESSVSNLLLGLIQDVLPRDGCQVEQVSFAMKCMILIKQSKLTIKGDLITPFWERYFHKKLTEQQLTLSLGMKGLTNIP
ncbi:protein MMS22-like [Tubulanus polymorphus]|uniref:protein MMS22-like n=1 Tax=Tubulanus polymorphus TaxID=672921 RepID=UPI003DA41593